MAGEEEVLWSKEGTLVQVWRAVEAALPVLPNVHGKDRVTPEIQEQRTLQTLRQLRAIALSVDPNASIGFEREMRDKKLSAGEISLLVSSSGPFPIGKPDDGISNDGVLKVVKKFNNKVSEHLKNAADGIADLHSTRGVRRSLLCAILESKIQTVLGRLNQVGAQSADVPAKSNAPSLKEVTALSKSRSNPGSDNAHALLWRISAALHGHLTKPDIDGASTVNESLVRFMAQTNDVRQLAEMLVTVASHNLFSSRSPWTGDVVLLQKLHPALASLKEVLLNTEGKFVDALESIPTAEMLSRQTESLNILWRTAIRGCADDFARTMDAYDQSIQRQEIRRVSSLSATMSTDTSR